MGHATWQELVCDDCGRPAGHDPNNTWGHLARNDDAEDFLSYWKDRGWVYDEKERQWFCPECADKKPTLCIRCGEEIIPSRKHNGEYLCNDCIQKKMLITRG
jgi:Zn finger protein HypA/HybF involved in hydrogenase expression